VPFNIASYSLLTMMIAHVTGLQPGEFVHTFGDVHIYSNHIEQVKLQLTREPRPLPTLRFARDVRSIDDFRYEDIIIENYDPHPHIKGEVAVLKAKSRYDGRGAGRPRRRRAASARGGPGNALAAPGAHDRRPQQKRRHRPGRPHPV